MNSTRTVQQEIAAVIQKQKELEEGFVEVSNRKKKNVRSRFKAGALDQPLILTLGVVMVGVHHSQNHPWSSWIERQKKDLA